MTLPKGIGVTVTRQYRRAATGGSGVALTRTLAMLLPLFLMMPASLAVDYVRLSPSEFAADLQKVSRFLDEQDYANAIDLLKVLVADEPDDATALSLMGYALRKSGQAERAEGFYKRALAADPRHLGALQYLGELYVEQGQLDLAEDQLRLLDASCEVDCAGRDALAAAIQEKRQPAPVRSE